MPESKYAAKLRAQGRASEEMTDLDELRKRQGDATEPDVPITASLPKRPTRRGKPGTARRNT